MIDAITVKDAHTLELKQQTADEAVHTYNRLKSGQAQEKRKGKEGLPTNYEISVKEQVILITGAIDFAIIMANEHDLLSENKGLVLMKEVEALRDKEKVLNELGAKKGIFAHRSLQQPIPQFNQKIGAKLTSEIKELLEAQKAEKPLGVKVK